MADDDGEGPHYLSGIGEETLAEADTLAPTPEQHERLKRGLHGELFEDIRRASKRYLVVGRGDGNPGERREHVCSLLNERRGAVAFRLEDFGLDGEELELWAPAFEILSEMATAIVGVLEDFDGGHVWELGYLYHQQTRVRDRLWLLKRRYETAEKMRKQYDNGMAASHLTALEQAAEERVIEWESPADLANAVSRIA